MRAWLPIARIGFAQLAVLWQFRDSTENEEWSSKSHDNDETFAIHSSVAPPLKSLLGMSTSPRICQLLGHTSTQSFGLQAKPGLKNTCTFRVSSRQQSWKKLVFYIEILASFLLSCLILFYLSIHLFIQCLKATLSLVLTFVLSKKGLKRITLLYS